MNKASPSSFLDDPATAGQAGLFGETEAKAIRVSVLFPLPLPEPFDYLCETETAPEKGSFVVAPFGPRKVIGVVWNTAGSNAPVKKLKTIEEILPAPPLPPEIVDFVEWAADYTMSLKGTVLRMVMRSGDALGLPRMQTAYVKSATLPEGVRMTPKREALLARADGNPQSASALASLAGVSEGVVRGLAKAGGLTCVEVDPDPPFVQPDQTLAGHDLSDDQQYAVDTLQTLITSGGHHAVLLDGVTGSGKTEVYFEAVAAALAKNPDAQVLILLPEIALTLPFLSRVEARFWPRPLRRGIQN